jgi:signal transduction histidine kinase
MAKPGLGLYIAKEITLAHGGNIHLVRSDESGTCSKHGYLG